MTEENMRILKMIEEGKISAEEGAELMQAVGEGAEETELPLSGSRTSLKGKKLRVKVTDTETGKNKVNIRIPLRLAKLAEKMIPKDAKRDMNEKGIDLDTIFSSLDELQDGPLVDIDADDSDDHVKVQIYVE